MKKKHHHQDKDSHHLVANSPIQNKQPEGAIVDLQGFVKLVSVHHKPAESSESAGTLTLKCLSRSDAASLRRSWSRSMMERNAPVFTAGTSGLVRSIRGWNGLIGTPCLCQDFVR